MAAAISTIAWLSCAPARDHPPVYPVKGKVPHKGKPVTDGYVLYELEGAGAAQGPTAESGAGPFRATGRIQADGTFQLRAFPDAEGIPEGRYRIGINSRPGRSEVGIFDAAPQLKKGNPDVFRGRYSDPKTSGLKGEVAKNGPNEPSFDLQ